MLTVTLLPACNELKFRDHDELVFTVPNDRARVVLPVRLQWRAHALVSNQRYAVLIDRAVPSPGHQISDPDQGVVITSSTSVTLDQMAIRGGVPKRDRDRHDIALVIIDGAGRRVGEHAAYRELRVVRDLAGTSR